MTPPSEETRSGAFPQCSEASAIADGGDGCVDMGRTSDHVGPVDVSEVDVDVDVDLDVDLEAPLETTGTEWADCIENVDSASLGGNQVLPGVSWSSVVVKGATHVARANCTNVVSPQKSPPLQVQWILLSCTNKVCEKPKTNIRLVEVEVMAQGEEQTIKFLLVLNCHTNPWWNQCI